MLSKVSTCVLLFTPLALAHGHVDEIWAPWTPTPVTHYDGWNPNDLTVAYPNNTPGWYTTNSGGNPLYPVDLPQNQIICAKGASNANLSAPIAAGSTLRVKWAQVRGEGGEWPPSHKGPIIDYIASCNGACSTVDFTTLKFVKFAQTGWINDSVAEGFWAADALRADDSSWNIKIPSGLKAGEYVLRHEIIALHLADQSTGVGSTTGPEFYPQCLNFKVTGSGTKTLPTGTAAKSLYRGDEPGLTIKNLHTTAEHADYIIPGPALWTGA